MSGHLVWHSSEYGRRFVDVPVLWLALLIAALLVGWGITSFLTFQLGGRSFRRWWSDRTYWRKR